MLSKHSDTTENLADALRRFVTAEELRYHIANTGQIIVPGRYELAPITAEINYVGHHIKQTRSLDRCARPCTLSSALRITAPVSIPCLPLNLMAAAAKEECRLEGLNNDSRSSFGSQLQPCSVDHTCRHYLAQVTLS